MASLDISSLYTNIPLDETIQICLDALCDQQDEKVFDLTRQEFKRFLSLATQNSIFYFNQ